MKLSNVFLDKLAVAREKKSQEEPSVYETLMKRQFPFMIYYGLAGVFNVIEEKLPPFMMTKTKLLTDHAQKDESGKFIMVGPNQVALKDGDNYVKELNELLAVEFEVPIDKPIQVTAKEMPALTLQESMLIRPFIEIKTLDKPA